MSGGTVHVVGAGLAGLSTALGLAERGRRVVVYEAARAAGGRCRSFADRETGLTLDNGNHLVLSGNRATIAYLESLGTAGLLEAPEEAAFPFIDLADGERWTLRPNSGRFPWWIGVAGRRVPGSRPLDYLGIAGLFLKPAKGPIGPSIGGGAPIDTRLWRPVLLAALNTAPEEGAVGLARRVVTETLMAGGRACRPMVAVHGLTPTFIEPALARLLASGGAIRYGSRLQALAVEDGRVCRLDFGEETVRLGPDEAVVLAVPAWIAGRLLPGLPVPEDFRGILNLHYAVPPPAGQPRLLGIVNGTAQWLFAFADRLSVTISDADQLMNEAPEALAERVWGEIGRITGLGPKLPAFRVVKERRATFAATPAEDRRRPRTRIGLDNLVLAGDWIDTGLPATIESAVRSGHAAAAALWDGAPAPHRRRAPAGGGAIAQDR